MVEACFILERSSMGCSKPGHLDLGVHVDASQYRVMLPRRTEVSLW